MTIQLGPSTGRCPADASNWRPRISQPQAPPICISSFTGIILLRKHLSALFLFFSCMIPYFVRPARRTRGFAHTPKFSYAQKIQVSKISKPTKSFDPLRHLKSLAPGRGHGKEVTRFFLFTSTVFNILLLHRTTEYIPYQGSRGPFSKFT